MTIEKKYRPRCFFDVETGGQPVGRIVFELFSDVCPITCENFRALCTGEKGLGKTTGKPLHYKDTVFHRVVRNFMVQGGDFSAGNGSGGESVYGGTFADENFQLKHDNSFYLSMANRGKDTNGSQFFITTQPTPHLDGVHVVFGRVISGQEIVTEVEGQRTDQSSRPFTDVKISNCGELVLKSKPKEKSRSKVDQDASPLEEGEMSDDKSKRKRKHKKHTKKNKKEKHRHRDDPDDEENDGSRVNRGPDPDCSVRADEIPDIPTNNFLMRRGPPGSEDSRRPTYRHEGYIRRTKISKSGRKIKGRGHMRYRTPSPEGSRSGSETPPHWKQAQSRVRSLKEVLEEKKRQLEELEAQESNEEMLEQELQEEMTASFSEHFSRGGKESYRDREEQEFHRKDNLEVSSDSRGREVHSSSNRRHSEHISSSERSRFKEKSRSREGKVEGKGSSEGGRGKDRRSHRNRAQSEDDEEDSSVSPVRRGMQSTIISKVVFQNRTPDILSSTSTRSVRRFTEDNGSKYKHEEKRSHSSLTSRKSPLFDSKKNTDSLERNGVSGSSSHRNHHRHHRQKQKEKADRVIPVEDSQTELGQSPKISLVVDKDTGIVDMDCTPVLHHIHDMDLSEMAVDKNQSVQQVLVPESLQILPEKRELYVEPEYKSLNEVKLSPRIRIPGLGSDDESDGSVEEEPPPPPGTEEIVLFKNYPPAMPPMPYITETKEFPLEPEPFETVSATTVKFVSLPSLPERKEDLFTKTPLDFPPPPTQRLPFLDDDTEDEPEPVIPPPKPKERTPPLSDLEERFTISKQIPALSSREKEKESKDRVSPTPLKEDSKVSEKSRTATKSQESSQGGKAEDGSSKDGSSNRSRTKADSSTRQSSRSPRRDSSRSRRRSTSRGRRRPSPPAYRNRSPIWRRSSDYRRPWETGRRRRSPSPDHRRSRSRSRDKSRRTPPRYSRNRRHSRSPSRGRRGKRSRSSSSRSSSSSSSSDSSPRNKSGKKASRSRSSSSSTSSSSSSS